MNLTELRSPFFQRNHFPSLRSRAIIVTTTYSLYTEREKEKENNIFCQRFIFCLDKTRERDRESNVTIYTLVSPLRFNRTVWIKRFQTLVHEQVDGDRFAVACSRVIYRIGAGQIFAAFLFSTRRRRQSNYRCRGSKGGGGRGRARDDSRAEEARNKCTRPHPFMPY